MGTRHMIGVIKNKKYVVGQYGQWDGYPDGQGAILLSILQNGGVEKLREKVDNCKFIDQKQVRQYYIDAGDSPDNKSGFISMEIAERMKQAHPTLDRDTGAKILQMIIDAQDVVELIDNSKFIEDDTFCEFAYVIDFDKNSLKFYCCGQKMYAEYPLTELPTVEEVVEKYKNFCNYEDE